MRLRYIVFFYMLDSFISSVTYVCVALIIIIIYIYIYTQTKINREKVEAGKKSVNDSDDESVKKEKSMLSVICPGPGFSSWTMYLLVKIYILIYIYIFLSIFAFTFFLLVSEYTVLPNIYTSNICNILLYMYMCTVYIIYIILLACTAGAIGVGVYAWNKVYIIRMAIYINYVYLPHVCCSSFL